MVIAQFSFQAFLLFLAAVGLAAARPLPYWKEVAPGPGFFPFWLSLLLALAVLSSLITGRISASRARRISDRNDERPDPFLEKASLRRVLATLFISFFFILLVPWLGMLLASGLYLASLAFYLGGVRPRSIVLSSFLISLLIYYLFEVWLDVPLPVGFLGL